jgi:hypothetical protein
MPMMSAERALELGAGSLERGAMGVRLLVISHWLFGSSHRTNNKQPSTINVPCLARNASPRRFLCGDFDCWFGFIAIY